MVSQPCPSDEVLLAFAEGLVPEPGRARVEAHLADCSDCCLVVGAAGDNDSVGLASATERSSPSPSVVPSGFEPETIGRYRSTAELGRGAMGRVLRAHDPALGREVAIKRILGDLVAPTHRARFQREARALARLRHPNVIAIFDAGEVDDDPYLVMELVEGADLRTWARGRGRREVLRCLREAGAGLASAHAAGIVHRDFKPANVLVGADGRPRVGDFGLATRQAGHPTDPDGSERVHGRDGSPLTAWVIGAPEPPQGRDALTRSGWMIGTPIYMAPEQLRGEPASEASDQFAFCVSAWELLFGQRPFEGRTASELRRAIERGAARPPARPGVSTATVDALIRGLAFDPAERHPNLDHLLLALRPPAMRSTMRWTAAALTAVALGGIALASSPSGSTCEEVAGSIDATWSAVHAQVLRRRAADSGLTYAPDSIERLVARLDENTDTWRDQRYRLCEGQADPAGSATRARTERCLDRWRGDAATALKWARDEQTPVERIPALFSELRDPSRCASPGGALAEALAVDLRPEIRAVQAKLDDARAQLVAHGPTDLANELAALESAVVGAEHPASLAKYRLLEGVVARRRSDPERAGDRLEAAFEIASQHGLDRVAAEAATELMNLHGDQVDYPRLRQWARHAATYLERLADPEATARFELKHARALVAMGADAEAATAMEAAMAGLEQAAPEVSLSRARARYMLGVWELSRFRYAEARSQLAASLQLFDRLVGPGHPGALGPLLGLVELDAVEGVTAQTDAHLSRFASITRDAYGPDDPRNAEVSLMAGRIAIARHDTAGAKREFESGLAHLEGKTQIVQLGVRLRDGLANVLADSGDHAGALALRLEVLDTLVVHTGAESAHTGVEHTFVGDHYLAMGRLDEARRHQQAAVDVLLRAAPRASPKLLVARTGLANVLRAQGDATSAARILETAIRDADPTLGSMENHAAAKFSLARALRATPAPVDATLARARRLAQEGAPFPRAIR